MKSVAFCTLGCKVNQYETQAMENLFAKAGYKINNFDETSDVYVINTCTVTGIGDRKSRQMIRRAKKLNPHSIIAVVGCYSQVEPQKVSQIEGVSLVLGTADRANIVEYVEEVMASSESHIVVGDIMKQRSYEDLWVSSYSSKTRAFVKIEDGCNEFCTYCIIPYARGPVRSRSLDSIKAEVTALAQNGFKEIVLTGIHMASYGKDNHEFSLIDAVRTVAGVQGIERIRISSLEPRVLTEDFVRQIATIPQMCNHFHIALQSGCDDTLRRMNRKYTTDQYMHSVELLRKYFHNPAIATDIMVGFPGETDEEFKASLDFARRVNFADAHVFAYSNRKGTKADKFENQIPPQTKEHRSHEMINCMDSMHQEYLKGFVGACVPILVEQEVSEGVYEGHTTSYIKVFVHSNTDITKQTVNVKITAIKGADTVGELV